MPFLQAWSQSIIIKGVPSDPLPLDAPDSRGFFQRPQASVRVFGPKVSADRPLSFRKMPIFAPGLPLISPQTVLYPSSSQTVCVLNPSLGCPSAALDRTLDRPWGPCSLRGDMVKGMAPIFRAGGGGPWAAGPATHAGYFSLKATTRFLCRKEATACSFSAPGGQGKSVAPWPRPGVSKERYA
jgi:hypothetical protein